MKVNISQVIFTFNLTAFVIHLTIVRPLTERVTHVTIVRPLTERVTHVTIVHLLLTEHNDVWSRNAALKLFRLLQKSKQYSPEDGLRLIINEIETNDHITQQEWIDMEQKITIFWKITMASFGP
ncbi:unnamed protein product [Dracunculus medinensis]|uniref:Secreted protein n=1 Tax=Dracunculus medinensis TaxID=318479 RepID=A0A0N4U3W2_DRAME|nr:unnamed protein product [Dracunculus medinensis]